MRMPLLNVRYWHLANDPKRTSDATSRSANVGRKLSSHPAMRRLFPKKFSFWFNSGRTNAALTVFALVLGCVYREELV